MRAGVDLDQGMIAALTRRRVEAGMTQAGLAELVNALDLGVSWSRTHVAAMEAGRRKGLRIIEIIALCAVHEVSLAHLLMEAGASAEQIATLLGHSVDDAELHTELAEMRRAIRAIHTALGTLPHRET